MCLILLALHATPDLPLVLAANRDEFRARPTAPAGPWPDDPQIIGGRDLQAGGSWLGMTLNGRWAAVTNFRETLPPPPDPPSRGHLVSDFLRGDRTPAEYLSHLQPVAADYNGFNLLVGDRDSVLWFSNRADDHPLLAKPLRPGIYGLSNHLLDTPWPKVERGKRDLASAIASGAGPDAMVETLLDRTLAADADLPRTGVPLELERALSSVFISGELYGTRSSTVIHSSRGGSTSFIERSFNPPATVSVVKRQFRLAP